MPAIYGGGAPNGESRVLVDPAAVYLGPLLTFGGYFGGYSLSVVVAPSNGHMYTCPASHPRVIKIDTDRNVKTEIGASYSGGGDKWNGMTVMPNGKIYCAPWGYNRIMKIDPLTDTTSLIGPTIEFLGRLPYYSRRLIVGDTLFLFPANPGQEVNSAMLQIDTSTDTVVFRSTGLTDSIFHRFISNKIVYTIASASTGRDIIALDINTLAKASIVNSDYIVFCTTDVNNPDINIMYINKTSIVTKNIQTLNSSVLISLPFETIYNGVVQLDDQNTEFLIIDKTGLNYVIYNRLKNSISEIRSSGEINFLNYHRITQNTTNFLNKHNILLCSAPRTNNPEGYELIYFDLKRQTFVKSNSFTSTVVYNSNIIFDKSGKLWIFSRLGTHAAKADIFPLKLDGKMIFDRGPF